MEPLRIAIVLPHLGVYGGIRRFLELARVWGERGHAVAILTPRPREGAVAEGEPWLPFGGERGGLERLSGGGWDALLSPDPDLFLRAESPGALRVFYAVLEKAPRAVEAWRRADLVLANSANMRRHLARHGIEAGDGVGGVNLGFFTPPNPDPRPARARAGGPVQVLVYGRLSRKRKGSETAARAVAMAARGSRAKVELTLFDAPPPGAPKPAPLGLGVPERWVFNPTQEALADLYRNADIFVSAERRAGWCNTAAEAMACGAAVVCTPSGTEDFARHGETAFVARWPWAWLLSRRIEEFLRDPERRLAIAANGKEAIQDFGWERTASRIEAAIRERMRSRDAAPPAAALV
ncbi:MAG TPA: glycosyltransferase [Candidatus Eisenbacteria bacterium]|nr:glycosyltransferase [Candidatus Eisenbacteria bacterium]